MFDRVFRFVLSWTALGAIAVLAISAIFKPETLPAFPICSFKVATGRPCPGCGLTRAFCAISHARFGDAFYFNPFSYPFYAATVALALWPLLTYFFPSLKQWFARTTLFVWLVPGVLVAMLIYGAFRMVYGPFV